MRTWRYGIALTLLASTLLAGCGGGGGSSTDTTPSGPVTSTLSFPLQSAYNAFIAGGVTKSFTVSVTAVSGITGTTVTCGGTGNLSTSPATTVATFEGKPALSSVTTVSINTLAATGCNAVSTTTTETDYFDSNFVALGHNSAGGDYGVFLTAPSFSKSSVVVTDSGTYGTETIYTNSTKTTGIGTSARRFIIEADTATSAIVNEISTDSDAAGNVTATAQSRYRITVVGALTPISSDVQFTNGPRVTIQYL